MSDAYYELFVDQGSGYWENIANGWNLGDEAATLAYAKYGRVVFEWKYTVAWLDYSEKPPFPPGEWTHRIVASPLESTKLVSSPTPSMPPTTPPDETNWGLVAVTGVAAIAVIAAFWWGLKAMGRHARANPIVRSTSHNYRGFTITITPLGGGTYLVGIDGKGGEMTAKSSSEALKRAKRIVDQVVKTRARSRY
jgi:hypothetical protein